MDSLAVAGAEVEFNTGAQNRLDALVKAQQALGQLEDAVQSPLTLPASALDATENNHSQGPKMKQKQILIGGVIVVALGLGIYAMIKSPHAASSDSDDEGKA